MTVKGGRFRLRVLAGCLCLMLSACARRVGLSLEPGTIQSVERFSLYSHSMEVRLSKPAAMSAAPVLVVYATGDGGWRGVDDDIFEWIASTGVPVAGFSSKNYLKNLSFFSHTETTTPRRLARDYRRIIDFARSKLNLPLETKLLLAGNSRGAGLAVSAAGQGELAGALAGVLAIALTKEEEHVLRRVNRRLRASGASAQEQIEIKTYEYLPRLAASPVCVIQSTNDKYVTASEARMLFGPDTDVRRLRPVESSGHTFSGGRDKLHEEVVAALDWLRRSALHRGAQRHAADTKGH